jgi:hypothetical protein
MGAAGSWNDDRRVRVEMFDDPALDDKLRPWCGAYDVFISYSHGDEAAAHELNNWLCAQGFSTFFDRSALRTGLRWIPALEEVIARSKAVAILVGKHGIGNIQQYEWGIALVYRATTV